MDYLIKNNKIIINQMDFNIKQTLECGQSFRFAEIDEHTFKIIAHNKALTITSNNNTIEFINTTEDDFLNIWTNYFDLQTDYSIIKNTLSSNDDVMKKCISFGDGIRILRQDPFEIIITFIISQNNRIPMIKKVIENLSTNYGSKINDIDYAFPTYEQLKNITIEQLNELKTGFRSKYIRDFLDKIEDNTIDIQYLYTLEYDELKKELMKIKGVGSKVSDCIILFGFSITNAFPVDVWIKRVVEYFYFDNQDTKKELIETFGKSKFNKLGGYAQQYLFYYARELQIGK